MNEIEDVFDFYDDRPRSRAKRRSNGKRSRKQRTGRKTPQPYVPTLEEIRARCLEIQAAWTPAEEAARRNESYKAKTPLPARSRSRDLLAGDRS
ncbi:MAG: hypothetical protein RIC55_12665 [Pirellulaceae bacterium]